VGLAGVETTTSLSFIPFRVYSYTFAVSLLPFLHTSAANSAYSPKSTEDIPEPAGATPRPANFFRRRIPGLLSTRHGVRRQRIQQKNYFPCRKTDELESPDLESNTLGHHVLRRRRILVLYPFSAVLGESASQTQVGATGIKVSPSCGICSGLKYARSGKNVFLELKRTATTSR
jgi:hypothetical protein